MVIVAALGLMVLAALMLAGWGWAFRRVFPTDAGWPETIVLGLGTVIFIGGILNLARLAHPWAIAVVAAAGIVLGVFGIREKPPDRPDLLTSLLILAAAVFTIVTQVPPDVYNFHDDLQKYFAYCVRMLETGTVFGSPLSSIGVQTLGAKAFIDGFIASWLPITYLNGVDALFGLLLTMILASQFGRPAALCALAVFAINPQYVNISPLYIGAALFMAIAGIGTPRDAEDACPFFPIALLYAALIALKPTFVIFVAIHFIAMFFADGIRWAWRAGLATVLFVSPWILLHAPNYVRAVLHRRLPPPHVVGKIEPDPINLFSRAPLDFGDTALQFTLLMAIGLFCGWLCRRSPHGRRMLAFSATGAVAYLVFAYILSPVHAGFTHSIRYFTPIAIGVVPPTLGWAGDVLKGRAWILPAVVIALFSVSLKDRVARALHDHSVAAYDWLSREPEYVAYSHRALSRQGREVTEKMQNLVPPGEPILAWMNTPFYFDYRRNPIIDVDMSGIGSPWAYIPHARYLILDYEGFPTYYEANYQEDALDVGAGERRNAEYSLDFFHHIHALADKGEVLFDNKEVKLVKIGN
jgi:hypothetical protein